MRKHRIAGLLTAGIMLMQSAAELPALTVSAAVKTGTCSLGEFASRVQNLTANDCGKEFFETLEFDTASGVLTADGIPTDSIGSLSVRGGRLMLQTGAVSGKTGVQSGGAYTAFEKAAAESGYTYTQTGSTMKITNEFQTARLIVKAAGAVDTTGAVSVAEGCSDLHILQYETPADAYAAYQKFSADARIQYVQPSHRIRLNAAAETAEAVCNTETHTYNTWGADLIGTEDFIEKYLSAELLPEVIVSVIDTGINQVPALFEGRILENGVNYSDSGDDSVADDYGHGTHCSGTICELTPSSVKILPVKVFDLNGSASDEQIYLGIVYSIGQGADVLNMSFGGLGVSPLEIEALEIAEENGVICCAAAGNNADDAAYYYPGGIASAITVGAVDSDMQLGSFSNFGRLVDVVAPGVGVQSYVLGETETLESWNGTSMATPHVAACCALLRTYDKTMTPRRAENLLRRNAADLGEAGFDETYGWGFVCMRDFQWDDGICMAPEFSVKSGNFGVQVTVALSCETEDAQIYYTADGSDPSPENGILYTEPISITETTLLLAAAVREGYVQSTVAEAVYTIGGKDIPDALTVENGVLTRYRGVRKQLTVPESVNGGTITAIGADAFAGNHFTEQIILPETVTSVGDRAFSGCKLLKTVSAVGVTEIGAAAFAGDSMLQSIAAAPQLSAVGRNAFQNCTRLIELDLTGITAVPAGICSGCAYLQTVILPDAVTFGDSAFLNCAALTRIDCGWTHVMALGNSAFSGCAKWSGRLDLSSLEMLGDSVFSGDSSLLRVSLPASITVLPSGTFSGCSGLKLLQLPGITQLYDNALAIGNMSSAVVTELDYAAITSVGTNAFFGFPIGNGFDKVTFSSLTAINYRSFAGVYAGALAFPSVTSVPEGAFADGRIGFVYLENAQSLAAGSLAGCTAAVLTKTCVSIDPAACPEGTWICSLDSIPALSALTCDYEFCDEPLVIRSSAQEVSVAQHAQTVLRMLAGGISLRYQWYLVSGETETEIAGASEASYVPDSSAAGVYTYRCIATDAGGKTERVTFQVTVTPEESVPEQLAAGMQVYPEGAAEYTVISENGSSLQIHAAGGAAVSGILTDPAGRTAAEFSFCEEGSVLELLPEAGKPYTLRLMPLWDAPYAVCRTEQGESKRAVSDCEITVSGGSFAAYEAGWQPAVTVTAPDGTVLTAGTDYLQQTVQHNQYASVYLFGTGVYGGYAEVQRTVWSSIPEDTAVTVALDSKRDTAVYAFVPRVSGTYYYYATYGEGYAEEQLRYFRTGKYNFSPKYANLRTKCAVSNRPDGLGAVLSSSSYSDFGGSLFGSRVELSAGQTYYFLCSGESPSGTALSYSLIVTQTLHDIRRAKASGTVYGTYRAGKETVPEMDVTLGGELLTEGVDYCLVWFDNDVPGMATVQITGMGKYFGILTKQFEMMYLGTPGSGQQAAINETVSVSCADARISVLWFDAEAAENDKDAVRYRVLNQRTGGGAMKAVVMRYSEQMGICTQMTPVSAAQPNDYELENGKYCVIVFRQYAETDSQAKITVVIPYALDSVTAEIADMPYTGAEVYPPMTVTAADGTVLTQGVDFTVSYPDRHILFGETRVVLRATNRSYGTYTDYFNIYVDLPEDAPELTVGEHTAEVTFTDRLAVYKLTAAEETAYTLASPDVMNIVLRVFTPEAKLIGQDYGNQTKSVSFTVPAGETRYIMVKFNGTDRCGTIRFTLATTLRLLQECEITAEPVPYTGEAVLPEVTFTDGDYTLTEGVDYMLRYTDDDVRIGTATANYIGLGRYFGTCDVTYHIVAADLFAAEDFEPYPLALDVTYTCEDDLEESYVYAKYTAGFADGMLLSVYNSECRLTVQRYDAAGHFTDSMFLKPSGEMTFDLAAGETCYFLFAAQDVASWNQSFRFRLTDPDCPAFKTVTEQGVTYRVFADENYAEVYQLNRTEDTVTLLPQIEGIPVAFVPEGLFAVIPDSTVVVGYAGCAAALYADQYGFAYVEADAAAGASAVRGDLNGDGSCSLADAVLLTHILTEHDGTVLAAWQLDSADLNGDGMLDLRDFRAMTALLAE